MNFAMKSSSGVSPAGTKPLGTATKVGLMNQALVTVQCRPESSVVQKGAMIASETPYRSLRSTAVGVMQCGTGFGPAEDLLAPGPRQTPRTPTVTTMLRQIRQPCSDMLCLLAAGRSAQPGAAREIQRPCAITC